jgi:hypothetical protein
VDLTLLLIAAVVLALIVAWRMATRGSRASVARNRRAQRGEAAAEQLLESEGFVVVERQASRTWSFDVDGEEQQAGVRADLLVERDERIYVAEVKTGTRAPDPRHPATRRQLLEYWLVYQPDGLLLVDMERGEVREVVFPFS